MVNLGNCAHHQSGQGVSCWSLQTRAAQGAPLEHSSAHSSYLATGRWCTYSLTVQ